MGMTLLACHMAAALGPELILDDHTLDPGGLELPDGADHVDGTAIAGVCIGDDRDADRLGDVSGRGDHLGLCEQAEVGLGHERCRGGVARDNHHLETDQLGDPGAQGIIGAGDEDGPG